MTSINHNEMMMKSILLKVSFILLFIITSFEVQAQAPKYALQSNPWSEYQLLSPETLVGMINNKENIKIYNIGVVQNIKGAIKLGASSEAENLEKLKVVLSKLPKNQSIVIYCGCCPMDKCPNIRPAFKMLDDQKFTKMYVLNLTTNIKVDWINKGYPVE